MGYAPVALITTPPEPARTGTTMSVKYDFGAGSDGAIADRYPTPPWTGLVWPNQEIPERGVNAEQITVTGIDLDTITFERDPDPSLRIEIVDGLQLATLKVQPTYDLGDVVTVTGTFATPNPPYTLAIQSPLGTITTYGPLEGVTDAGNGIVNFQFQPDNGGQWSYRFADADGNPLADGEFFVRFSDASFAPPVSADSTPVEVQYIASGWQGTWNSSTAYSEGDLVLDSEVVYQAVEDVGAGGDPPSFNPSSWNPVFDPGSEAPELLADSTSVVIRVVSADDRADAPNPPNAPCFLAVVDLGGWGQPAEEDAAFSFYWERGASSNPDDASWGVLPAGCFDGTFTQSNESGLYYRCRVRLTNSNGFAETTSNIIGPLG